MLRSIMVASSQRLAFVALSSTLAGVLLVTARAGAEPPAAQAPNPVLLAAQPAPFTLTMPSAPATISVAPPASGIFERVPTASWAMGCTAGVALVVHALYQNLSDKRRAQLAGQRGAAQPVRGRCVLHRGGAQLEKAEDVLGRVLFRHRDLLVTPEGVTRPCRGPAHL